jgi:hypothetical protein
MGGPRWRTRLRVGSGCIAAAIALLCAAAWCLSWGYTLSWQGSLQRRFEALKGRIDFDWFRGNAGVLGRGVGFHLSEWGEQLAPWRWRPVVTISQEKVSVGVPFWMPFSLAIAAASALLVPLAVRASRRRRGRCVRCGYDRSGVANQGACPECGTAPTG